MWLPAATEDGCLSSNPRKAPWWSCVFMATSPRTPCSQRGNVQCLTQCRLENNFAQRAVSPLGEDLHFGMNAALF